MLCVLSLPKVAAFIKGGSTPGAAVWALEFALEWVEVVGGVGL